MSDTIRGCSVDVPGGPPAALCLHGLSSTPYELRPVTDALADEGMRVLAPHLVGHGARPEMLQHTRWEDWIAAARRHFDRLADEHDEVFLIGMSMGALLALVVAHERGARVGGVVAMATPLELAARHQWPMRLFRHFPLLDTLPFAKKDEGPDVSDPAVAAAMPGYDRLPLQTVASMLDGQREALERAPRLSCPVLVLHGRHDHMAPVRNAHKLISALRTRHRRLVIYPQSWHILPLDVEHEAVARDVVAFIKNPIAFTEVGR